MNIDANKACSKLYYVSIKLVVYHKISLGQKI